MIVRKTQPQRAAVRSGRSAFTLMEVLIVTAIILVLAGVASIYVFKYVEDARVTAAHANIKTLETAVNAQALQNGGVFPETLQEILPRIQGASETALIDPWGNPYQYTHQDINGQHRAVIQTTAPDGTIITNIRP